MGKRSMWVVLCGSLALVAGGLPSSSAAIGLVGPSLHCERQPCSYALASGAFSLEYGEDSIGCEQIRGTGRFTTATTSQVRLTMSDCREEDTPFRFSCVGARSTDPSIRSKELATHLMTAEELPEMLVDGFEMALTCGGGERSVLKGFFRVRIPPQACDLRARVFALPTELVAHGGDGPGEFFDIFVDGKDLQFDEEWQLIFSGKASISC